QIKLLELLIKGHTIKEIVSSHQERKVNVPFSEWRKLLEFLVAEGMIDDPAFTSYFTKAAPRPKNFISKLLFSNFEPINVRKEIKRLPFFRVMKQAIVDQFMNHSKLIHTPAHIVVCHEGRTERSLLVLLRGQASVFAKVGRSRRKLATLTAGSIFGEVGF